MAHLALQPSDYRPDENFPKFTDIGRRFRYSRDAVIADHTTLAVNDTQTQNSIRTQRVRSVEVQGVAGGTVTIQVQVNGRDIFPDANRPVSDAGVAYPHRDGKFNFPAGATISTIIEATSGVPTGTANVVIDTEPFTLEPKWTPLTLHGRDRLSVSKRRETEFLNAIGGEPNPSDLAGVGAALNQRIRDRIRAGVSTPPPIPRVEDFRRTRQPPPDPEEPPPRI